MLSFVNSSVDLLPSGASSAIVGKGVKTQEVGVA